MVTLPCVAPVEGTPNSGTCGCRFDEHDLSETVCPPSIPPPILKKYKMNTNKEHTLAILESMPSDMTDSSDTPVISSVRSDDMTLGRHSERERVEWQRP